jgi:hypothetical protein
MSLVYHQFEIIYHDSYAFISAVVNYYDIKRIKIQKMIENGEVFYRLQIC